MPGHADGRGVGLQGEGPSGSGAVRAWPAVTAKAWAADDASQDSQETPNATAGSEPGPGRIKWRLRNAAGRCAVWQSHVVRQWVLYCSVKYGVGGHSLRSERADLKGSPSM